MGANAEIFPLAKSFLLIRSISAPAELWYSIYWLYWYKGTYTDAEGAARLLVAKGASYGHQNTKAPLIAITIGSAAHLVLDYLFIIHLNFSGFFFISAFFKALRI
jgi:Na+-driven multidrug efflux pump